VACSLVARLPGEEVTVTVDAGCKIKNTSADVF